jgi:putative sporulation protein YyaC
LVAHEDVFKGSKIKGIKTREELVTAMSAIIPSHLTNEDVVFLCIGTDRSTGDSLAPLVGTYLQGLGYTNIKGTIDEPVHALNLQETLNNLPEDKKVIAIDACLGQFSSVGKFDMINGSIKAGSGVGKELPSAGDYSILGIVNIGGFMEYFVLQNTRLSVVMRMAKDITSAIVEVFPLKGEGDPHNDGGVFKEVRDNVAEITVCN